MIIDELRRRLDDIDGQMMRLLESRLDVSKRIAEYKRINKLPVCDKTRERAVLKSRINMLGNRDYENCGRIMAQTLIELSKMEQKKAYNLYLIGMPGAGKSAALEPLGKMLSRDTVDTDAEAMRISGMDIDTMFRRLGEDGFRRIESRIIFDAARRGGLVVATGGGAVTSKENMDIMRNSGYTVFLDRRINRLINIDTENRPLIRGGGDKLIRLYRKRKPLYRECADFTVDPDVPGLYINISSWFEKQIGLNLLFL